MKGIVTANNTVIEESWIYKEIIQHVLCISIKIMYADFGHKDAFAMLLLSEHFRGSQLVLLKIIKWVFVILMANE